MLKHKIILNPISGRGFAGRARPLVEKTLHDLGVDFDLVCSERPWHAAELAEQAAREGYDVVVAAGGDGTANEVLNGLMRSAETTAGSAETTAGSAERAKASGSPKPAAALGVLGIGRGNDFAYGLGVPGGVEAGCRILAKGERRRIDVGWVAGGLFPQGRYFGNGVGIGFDAVVGFEAVKLAPLSGFASYIVAALKTIFLYELAPKVRLECNGQEVTQPSLMVSVMNGRRLGGGFYTAPEARNGDGVFDVCIAGEASQWHVLQLLLRFMKGTQVGDPAIRYERTARIAVSSLDGGLPAHLDGETLCVDGQRLVIELRPAALEAVCPAAETA